MKLIKKFEGEKASKEQINVLIDYSGSIPEFIIKKLEDFLSNYSNRFSLNVVLCDVEVIHEEVLEKGKNFKFPKLNFGKGGTVLQNGFNKLMEKGKENDTIIFTDGFCDIIERVDYRKSIFHFFINDYEYMDIRIK